MKTEIYEIYKFYTKRLVLGLRNKPFAKQIEVLTDIRVTPLIFDFCGITKKINYFGDVYIVYDYKLCYGELSEIIKDGDIAIFLMDRQVNVSCFEDVENCKCVLCNNEDTNVLVNYF